MKTPLHVIIKDLSRRPLSEQIDMLIAAVAAERPHSVRRAELLSLLQEKRRNEMGVYRRTKRRAA